MPDRLFIYGSLQPGGANEHVLASVEGEWEPAIIKGTLVHAGWGAELGYPGLLLDPEGGEVPGYVFSSSRLSSKWAELDAFEGPEYRRVTTMVVTADGREVEACVYALRAEQVE